MTDAAAPALSRMLAANTTLCRLDLSVNTLAQVSESTVFFNCELKALLGIPFNSAWPSGTYVGLRKHCSTPHDNVYVFENLKTNLRFVFKSLPGPNRLVV